jgi:hypothetical protein
LKQYQAQEFDDKDRPYSFCLRPKTASNSKRTFVCSSASQEGTIVLQFSQTLSDKYNWIEAINEGEKLIKEHLKIEEKLRTNYRIPAEEIEWKEEIAKGASGLVKKGKKRHYGTDKLGVWLGTTEVAVKALNNVVEFIDDKELESFYKEIEILR